MKPDIASRLKDLTRPTGTEDLLDVDYPTPRFTISLRHAAVVAGVAAAGVGTWFLVQDDVPDPPTMSALAQPTASPTAHTIVKPEDSGIVVSVMGHVTQPGLVTLPVKSRVADALAAAGALPDAELSTLNLAQVLEDGVQIVVLQQGMEPATPPVSIGVVGGTTAGDASGGLVSLNNATAVELTTLPGVGEKTAQAIIDFREVNGGFTSVDELLNVKGIGPSKFEQLSDAVAL